jgi:hypothetical protein
MNDEMIIRKLIELMKANDLRDPEYDQDGKPGMVFHNTFSDLGLSQIEADRFPFDIPNDMRIFWEAARYAKLFEDVTFGQWGLHILDPQDAARETGAYSVVRKRDCAEGDLVIGTFIGDSDLLLLRCDPHSPDFGSVIVCNPIYSRGDWFAIANSFREFLLKYVEAKGEMYWEKR